MINTKELIFERFCEMWGDWWNVPISCPCILMKENANEDTSFCSELSFKVAGKTDKPLTLYTVRKYAKELCDEGYLEKAYYGGSTEDGIPYCTHGYLLTNKAKMTDTFKRIRQELDKYWKEHSTKELFD